MAKTKVLKCCFCKKVIEDGFGNNPSPLRVRGRCCNECNMNIVVPYRILMLMGEPEEEVKEHA